MPLLMLFALHRRRRHRDHAVRAAGAPGAAVRERRRRPPAAARDRARAGDHVHDRDRRAGPARQGRRAGQRARARTLAIVVLIAFGARPADPRARRARPGAALAPGPLRAQDARRRLLVRRRRRRRARVRVRSVRRPDPRRRDLGQRLGRRVGASRRGGDRLRGRARAPCCCSTPSGGRARDLEDQALGPGPHRRARARGGAAPDRRRDGHQPRRPLRGGAGQGQRACPPSWSTRRARWRTRARSRTGSRRCGRRRGSPLTPAQLAAAPSGVTPRCPSSAPPRTSPTPSTGSTRPAAGR